MKHYNTHNNSNSTAEEISHFATLSEHWWDKTGPLRTLHDINPTRLQFILKHTSLKHQKVLDVGCGGGIFSEALAKEGALVTAIDLESNAIEIAKKHAKTRQLSIDYECTSIEALVEEYQQSKTEDKQSELYDIVTCMEMLEHVPHPEQIIEACASLLKPQGKLFLSTINRTWKAYGLAIVAAEHLLNLVPKNTHHYDNFIKPSEIAQWLRNEKLSLQALAGLEYNPCSHQASLTDNLDIGYLVMAELQG